MKGLALSTQRIEAISKKFTKVSQFHVLRGLNNEADKAANAGVSLAHGWVSINDASPSLQPLP
jgi:hypothetical protein